MKLLKLFTLAILAVESSALTITQPPKATDAIEATGATEATEAPRLAKRARVKEKIYGKGYQEQQAQKEGKGEPSTTKIPKPWARTITSVSSTKVVLVKPTVIAGVTFSTRPPKTTNGLENWVSLQKDGSPKTIKPEHKGGQIKNGKPDYGTWFGTASIIPMGKDDIKAENMEEGEVYEHHEYIAEDPTYHELNPIIRCTPDRYFKRGMGKHVNSEPFCTPHENQQLKMDKTYFITWFSRYFKDAKKVRVHLSFLKESARQKGLKRSLEDDSESEQNLTKRSSLEKGATIKESSFFYSDWLDVEEGMLPVTILEEWFGKKDWYRKVLISLQPDNVDDEEFDYTKDAVIVEIIKGAVVSKGQFADLKKLEEKWKNDGMNVEYEDSSPYEKYYIMMAVPSCVALFGLGMYIFVMINNKNIDLSHLKKRQSAGRKTTHRRIPFKKKTTPYSELPQYKNDAVTKAD